MAWTAPTTRTTGTLITASIWNADIVDNLDALKDPPTDHYELDEVSDYTTSSTSFTDVDATNLAMSVTTTGGDVIVEFHGTMMVNATYFFMLDIDVDGSREGGDDGILSFENASGEVKPVSFSRLITGLAAGSHTFKLQWKVMNGAATVTLSAGAGTSNKDVHGQFWAREVS